MLILLFVVSDGHTKYTFKIYSLRGNEESHPASLSLQTIDGGREESKHL